MNNREIRVTHDTHPCAACKKLEQNAAKRSLTTDLEQVGSAVHFPSKNGVIYKYFQCKNCGKLWTHTEDYGEGKGQFLNPTDK